MRTAQAAAVVGPSERVAVRCLGEIEYDRAREMQRAAVESRRCEEIPDTLLLLSHPPIITMGRAGGRHHLLEPTESLLRQGVGLVETDRGGDITYHGPGQIVGYAIVDLRARERDLHRFLREIEETIIRALAEFGIEAGRIPQLTGVWVGDSKIAAMGVRVSRWITHHGFALNVDPDLSHFELIVPCGLPDKGVTSMVEILGRSVDEADVEAKLANSFGEVFGSCRAR